MYPRLGETAGDFRDRGGSLPDDVPDCAVYTMQRVPEPDEIEVDTENAITIRIAGAFAWEWTRLLGAPYQDTE